MPWGRREVRFWKAYPLALAVAVACTTGTTAPVDGGSDTSSTTDGSTDASCDAPPLGEACPEPYSGETGCVLQVAPAGDAAAD